MKRIKSYLCISGLSILVFSFCYATSPSLPSLKMEMSIIQDGTWEVGKENTVTFKFKPLEEVPHKTKHPDEAVVTFDSGLVLVSGNSNWSGILEKGREYSISVVLRPTKAGKLALWGFVEASLSKIYTDEELRKMEEASDKVIEQSPELKKMGLTGKYPKKRFFFHNETSSGVNVQGEIPTPDTSRDETNVIKIKSLKDLGPPPTITEGRPLYVVCPGAIIPDSIKTDTTKVEQPR